MSKVHKYVSEANPYTPTIRYAINPIKRTKGEFDNNPDIDPEFKEMMYGVNRVHELRGSGWSKRIGMHPHRDR